MSAVLDTLKKNEQDCVSEPLDTVTEQTVEPSQNDPQPAEKPQEVLQCELWASDLQRLYNDEAEHLRLAADFKKKAKEMKERRDQLLFRGPHYYTEDQTPLITWGENQIENQNESWKTFLIKDHFSLTKKQLEKIDLTQESTVGQLADIVDRLNNGNEINGVGNKLMETLVDQFESFWSSPAYQATLDDTITDDHIDLIANIHDALMAPPH